MRIAIVNDTRIAVEALRRAVLSRGHQVAWVALNGAQAVDNCARDTPDLILMDLIMPELNGVEATRRIMAGSPCAILIVTSSVRAQSGAVFTALGLGALDSVRTPTLGLDGSGSESLLYKIDTIEKLLRYSNTAPSAKDGQRPAKQAGTTPSTLVVIGASAGGPKALATILSALPADFGAGLAIVQHLDREFAESLANWLNQQCALKVKIAPAGASLVHGTAWLAGTGTHMVLSADARLNYQAEPSTESYHPSIDVFFDSVAKNWRGPVVAAVLTGMGRDGASGLLKLRERGHHTIAQDQATSAVYGMPRAAWMAGGAVEALPLGDIAAALVRRVKAASDPIMNFEPVQAFLSRECGFKPDALGPQVISRAAMIRMTAVGATSPQHYVEALKSRRELQELLELLVNAETWFFRETQSFPDMVEMVRDKCARSEGPVRILSVPCSTGEEPYSLVMALMDGGVPDGSFAVDAVDISARALATAKQAIYKRGSFRGAALAYRDRHFRESVDGWRLSETVRSAVRFIQADVLNSLAPPHRYDVIVCRNLLIYLNAAACDRLFEVMDLALAPDGYLVLSSSETFLAPARRFHKLSGTMFCKAQSPLAPGKVRPSVKLKRVPARAPVAPAPMPPRPVEPPPAPVTNSEDELAAVLDLANQGRYDQASARCRDFIKRSGPSAQAYYLFGLMESARGDDAAAAESLRRALYLDPQHESAHLLLGLVRQKVRQDHGGC